LNSTQSSSCDQQLKSHPSKFGKLACALYAMKPDWSFGEQVEAAALTYEPANSGMTFYSNMKNTGGLFPWPCEGDVSSGFGMRWGKMHKGVDIANSLGTPIYAVADGVVTVAKADPGGFGFFIVIDHGNGISTLYGHIYPETVKVKVGQHVKKGQLIAAIGSNGHSTGPHLHFEVHVNDTPVDPVHYLMKR
jgi:murein DD-endopeptidase MepM/ murein hydrolase activator NlpD